jgi:hypothetical protein
MERKDRVDIPPARGIEIALDKPCDPVCVYGTIGRVGFRAALRRVLAGWAGIVANRLCRPRRYIPIFPRISQGVSPA